MCRGGLWRRRCSVGICLILIQNDTGPEAVNREGFAMKLIKNENIQAHKAEFVVWSRNLFQIPFTIKAVDVGYLISGNCAFNLIAKVCSSIIGCAGAQPRRPCQPRRATSPGTADQWERGTATRQPITGRLGTLTSLAPIHQEESA